MLCVDSMTFDPCRDYLVSKLQLFWYRSITTVDRFRGATNAICLSLTTPAHILHCAHSVAASGKVCYCRGTARRAMSVEILSTAVQLYEKSHFEGLAIGVWLWKERKGRVFI